MKTRCRFVFFFLFFIILVLNVAKSTWCAFLRSGPVCAVNCDRSPRSPFWTGPPFTHHPAGSHEVRLNYSIKFMMRILIASLFKFLQLVLRLLERAFSVLDEGSIRPGRDVERQRDSFTYSHRLFLRYIENSFP